MFEIGTKVIEFVSANWQLIKENVFVFIMGWAISAAIGAGVATFIHRKEKKQLKENLENVQNHYEALSKAFECHDSRDNARAVTSGMGKKSSPMAKFASKALK